MDGGRRRRFILRVDVRSRMWELTFCPSSWRFCHWLWPRDGTYYPDVPSLFFPFPPLTCQPVLMPVQCPRTRATVSEGTCKTVMPGKEDDWRSWRAITAPGKGHVLWDLLLTPANRGDYGRGYKSGDLLSYRRCLMFPLNLTLLRY